MFSYLTRTAFVAAVFVLVLIGAASADQWHIARSSGVIWVGSSTAQLVSLGPTTDVAGGATVMTGDDGRAFLVRGSQTLLIGPNTVVTLPDGDSNGITTILQRAGEITFDVDHQKIDHFKVETPFLAAVVKGTNFTVRVDDDGATVTVNRGLVEVTDLATGDMADTPAGQVAEVRGPAGKFTISGSGSLAVVKSGSPRAPLVDRLSSAKVRGLQVTALNNSKSELGLTLIAGDDGAPGKTATAGLAAGASNNNGGGPDNPGGGATKDGANGQLEASSDGGTGPLAIQGPSLLGAVDDARPSRSGRDEGEGLGPLVTALGLAGAIVLALGFAYFKERLR